MTAERIETPDVLDELARTLSMLGGEESKLVILDAGSPDESGSSQFRRDHPERFFDFGVAPQNMLSAAGGLASVGLVPVVTCSAMLCLRGLEQARNAFAFPGLNVKVVASRAGTGAGLGGAPVQTVEDIAAFRAIPGITVLAPADARQTVVAVRAMLAHEGPVYLRLPSGDAKKIFDDGHDFVIGRADIVRPGGDVAIIACGAELTRALEAAALLEDEDVDARVVNMASIKPIDREAIVLAAVETGAIVTAEDHSVVGGLGSAVAEVLASAAPCPLEFVGIADCFGTAGRSEELAEHFGIAASHIASAARRAIARRSQRPTNARTFSFMAGEPIF